MHDYSLHFEINKQLTKTIDINYTMCYYISMVSQSRGAASYISRTPVVDRPIKRVTVTRNILPDGHIKDNIHGAVFHDFDVNEVSPTLESLSMLTLTELSNYVSGVNRPNTN